VKPFLYLVIVSALVIAATAALFSVTGIATAFSGHFLQVAIMAGAIEAGKIVVASVLYRYWKTMAWIHKSYLSVALVVLMAITSAGIFGYLSEAYQKTKGDFTIIEKQANILKSKKAFFEERRDRLKQDKAIEITAKLSNQVRADSLTSRGQSITRTRDDIKLSDSKITLLENQISSMEDSVGVYDLKIVELESANIKGELGPLTYIASALNMEMDDVVKWFILVLVFVFDPLAVSLIVAANMIYLKRSGKEHHEEQAEFTEHFVNKAKKFKGILNKENFSNLNKISSEDIKPETSKVVDEHFDELLEEPKIKQDVLEGSEEMPLEDKKKPNIFRKFKSANWRD